ncbi:MAG: hypothetical protein JWQ74_980 [Marmoricola sp.]|nr:hypothetical protein [Marmoricola sp.]
MTFSGSPLSFDQLLTRGAAVVLGAVLVWVLVLVLAVLVEAVTAGRVRLALALGCPRVAHRWLLAVAGAAISATVLVPSSAQASPSETYQADVLDGLSLPDRTAGGPPRAVAADMNSSAQPRARTRATVSAWVTVRAGDSLWAISRSLLPPDASPRRIAQHAHRLFVHNRRAIGENPDLIRPSQRLAVPPSARETYSEDS